MTGCRMDAEMENRLNGRQSEMSCIGRIAK